MADVFISYRRSNHMERVQLLRDRLEKKCKTVFLDTTMGPGDFNELLMDEIEKCSFFLLLVSDDSFERCWQEDDVYRREIEHAKKNGKIIIPVMDSNYRFPDRLPDTIDFVRNCNGIVYTTQHLDYFVDDLVNRLMKETTTEKKAEERPRQADILKPASAYTGTTLDEMARVAQQDVANDYSLYQTIEKAQQGDPDAQKKVAQAYLSDSDMFDDPDNPKKARYWLEKAVEQGNAEAMYLLGNYYHNSVGGEQNYARAAYWYEKSATQPIPYRDAVFAMADCYYWGKGVPDDLLKKAEWYCKAMRYEWIFYPEEDITYAERYYRLFLKSSAKKKLIINGYVLSEIPENKYKLVQSKVRKETRIAFVSLGLFLHLACIIAVLYSVGMDSEWSNVTDLWPILFIAEVLVAMGITPRFPKIKRIWPYIVMVFAESCVLLAAGDMILRGIAAAVCLLDRSLVLICCVLAIAVVIIMICIQNKFCRNRPDLW